MARGIVFAGNGNCSRYWSPLLEPLTEVLGYTPFPGSLNVVMLTNLDLPRPKIKYWDRRRPRIGKKGGMYHFWPARFGHGSHVVNAHVMRPDVRGHGANCVELVAPIKLREEWGLTDGSQIWIQLR